MSDSIPAELLEAYRATEFWVGDPPDGFCLRVGQRSEPLAKRLADADRQCAAYLTAHNPRSETRSAEANAEANRKLRQILDESCEVILEGVGRDAAGRRPGEDSFLAIGLDLETAKKFGRQFGQHAIVWAGGDAIPRLVLCGCRS